MADRASRWDEIARLAVSPAIHTLSLDIFDTLLLRRVHPELYRFLHMAERISRALGRHGIDRPAGEVFQARLLAARMVYRTAPECRGEREAQHDRIVALQLQALGLPATLASELIAIEGDYEATVLAANRRVVGLAETARAAGKRVILVSDMYLRRNTLQGILAAHGVAELADAIYVSSEFGMTKHGGGLYRQILETEGLPPAGYVHLGDNRHADFASARRVGLRSAWCPRPLLWRVINYGWNNLYRAYAAVT